MAKAIYPHSVIIERLHRAQEICRRIETMKHERWVRACHDAGIDANMCMLHNALVSRDCGKPWAEVNYSKARLANRIANDWRASNIVDKFYRRMVGLI